MFYTVNKILVPEWPTFTDVYSFYCLLHLPVNPVWRVPGFMKEGKADNEHSNPCFITLAPKFTNICISHLQLLHFQNFLLEVVAIGRKNAVWEPDIIKNL